jgi:type III pantothenate kinase
MAGKRVAGELADVGSLSIVAVDVGNTNIGIARWVQGDLLDVRRVRTADGGRVREVLDEVRAGCENRQRQAIVIASVVPAVTGWLSEHIEEQLDMRPFVIGGNTPLPVEVAVREPGRVGVDRVCCAAAAYDRLKEFCVVVSVGSAVTIDVIDGQGTFRGGAILPGLKMQAKALAEHTAVLPEVEPVMPGSAVGQDTIEAIQSGICFGTAGAIRGIVEQIATDENKWPPVIVTGGGAEIIRARLDFADRFVPNLCLMGAGLAYMKRVAREMAAPLPFGLADE